MRHRPRGAAALAVALALAILAPAREASAASGEISVLQFAFPPPAAELKVRGRPVARLLGPGALRRLQETARRLDPLLVRTVAVTVTDVRGTARLVVGGVVVLSADRSDAARQGTTPGALVRYWARALEDAVAVPPITFSRSSLVLSPGQSAIVTVGTLVSGPPILGDYDRRIVSVSLDGGEVRIIGRSSGSAFVPIRVGPYRAQIAVSVRPPAGAVPPSAEVIVTGTPAPADLIREAIERRLYQVVQRAPGAVVEFGPIAAPGPLDPGTSVTVPVALSIRSPTHSPVEGTVNVMATNVLVRPSDPEVLLVSNRPETITGNGLLFQETLQPGRGARLLYHHRNGTPGQARVLKVTLATPGPTRARVHYMSGLAGPSPDPLLIGSASTARFLEALTAGRGYVVEIPPKTATTFTAYTLPPLALVSGLMQLQVIEGGPVDLTVYVRLPYLLDRTVTADLGPLAFPHPRGTFPGSVVTVARDLPANQPAPVTDLGVASELRDIRSGEPLVGDYGVLYRLRLRLSNPTDREVTTALLANAAGGTARGLFLIDGATVDIGLLRPTEERVVATFIVPPGSTREITILTMPIAGSFYPVRLTMRPQ